MAAETHSQQHRWRTALLPLALAVPIFAAYTVFLQITQSPAVQTTLLSLLKPSAWR